MVENLARRIVKIGENIDRLVLTTLQFRPF